MTILLHQLHFFAYHGLFDEEKIVGGQFELNVEVEFEEDEKIIRLNQSINYTAIYEVIKTQMAIPTLLLETLVQTLIEKIRKINMAAITAVQVEIKKINPPIPNFTGQVGIRVKSVF
jgi:7,8-dihydroneopterin aldolase/epimerase/oxygenase